MVQHKEQLSDQASGFSQREDREWKYQKKSAAGGWVCKLSVATSRQQQQQQQQR